MIFFIHRETMGLIYLLVAMKSLPLSHAQRQKKKEKRKEYSWFLFFSLEFHVSSNVTVNNSAVFRTS